MIFKVIIEKKAAYSLRDHFDRTCVGIYLFYGMESRMRERHSISRNSFRQIKKQHGCFSSRNINGEKEWIASN